jgi:mannose-6-phosphate isomerase-like protein (cupin superfamily)
MEKFNPNAATFEDGIERVKHAISESGLKIGKKVITSQDDKINKTLNLLVADNVPKGFKKWQLPFVFSRAQFFISVANPDISVPEHSHDEGDGVRFIVSGSVYYKDKELKAGDWMYIPKGSPYEIKIGNMGAVMCYCYACCCAPTSIYRGEDVINPNPFLSH